MLADAPTGSSAATPPEPVAELLAELDERRVRLLPDGDQLRCTAPAGVLTEELLARIRRHRVALLDMLAERDLPPRTDEGAPAPLSHAQQPIWLAEHLDPGGSVRHIPLAARLRGPLPVPLLHAALAEVVHRHDVLRTTFPVRAGRPLATVQPFRPPALPVVDLSGLTGKARAVALDALTADAALRPFDLTRGPGLRGALVRLGEEEHELLVTRHHLASDGWSFGLLAAELSALYRALGSGEPSPLPALPRRYADFAHWQRGREGPDGASVWARRLDGAPFRLDMVPGSGPGTGGVPGAGTVHRLLPAALVDAARAAARTAGCTLFTVLATAFGLALGAAAGRREVVVGVPASGRTRPELEALIGCFATMLPLRLAAADADTFGDALTRTHAVLTEALAHQDVPAGRIADAVHRHGGALFEVALAFQNTPDGAVDLPGVAVDIADPAPTTPPFPLTVTITANAQPGDGVRLRADHDIAAFADDTVADVLDLFLALLRIGCVEPALTPAETLARGTAACRVGDGPTADGPTARSRPGHDAPRPPAPAPGHPASLGERFSAVAARVPDAIAVAQDGAHLSYAALSRRARTLAAVLRGLGVGPEVPVAVRVAHVPELVVAELGVVMAGGVCVPLDGEDPPARQEAVIVGAGVEVVVTTRRRADEVAWFDGPVVRVDRLPDPEPDPGQAPAEPAPDNMAYVVHTSGSSGVPKGVMVTHANLVALLDAAVADPAFSDDPGLAGAGHVWSLTHSSAFDFSVWEMWGALLTGSRLVVVPREVVRDPPALGELLVEQQVSVFNATPSTFLALARYAASAIPRPSPAIVVLGGERCEPADLRGWFAAAGGRVPVLVNMYGITETTVHVTARRILAPDVDLPGSPIGRPLAGMSAHVLGPAGVPTVVGGRGELWVGGTGVARGYLDRPGWTADRFRPDPFDAPGARLYRSGDGAHLLPGGELGHLGRLDAQVKVRGYRVEPGEIEAALCAHPGVAAAVVLAAPSEVGPTLVGYVLPVDATDLSVAQLRAHLHERLPPHLVPARIDTVAEFPLTRNGKLDRDALAARRAAPTPVAEPDLPHSDTERAVAGLWCELLGRDAVGVHDDFFDLGGDSLLITRLHARLPTVVGVELPMRRVYRSTTVAALASAIDEQRASR